ncbi:histidinol-phosphate transaminase [Porticoccaceae bacterium]|nr:histidinol-phosphate transaminase [Porticoccaceae bacterium]
MSKYWSDFVLGLEPYVPGEQPANSNLTKLNTNENPYPPSPAVMQAMESAVNDDLRLYPPSNADQLKQCLAGYFKLTPAQVFVGNGSDEVLAHVFNGLFRQAEPILYPDISYSFYPVYCGLYDIEFSKIPLADDDSLDLNDYRRANGGIIFPNPNAPTGRLLGLDAIEALLQDNRDSVVVVDEAYIDFAEAGSSAVSLIDQYDNLLVVQTMSKSRSLAGMRIGYALGSAVLIEGLERIKNSFNSYPLGHVQLAAAVASFNDPDYFEAMREQVISSREWMVEQLQGLGFEVLPSTANFVLARHSDQDGLALTQSLRDKNIIIRHFNKPRLSEFLRITVGTSAQNQQLIDALGEIIG